MRLLDVYPTDRSGSGSPSNNRAFTSDATARMDDETFDEVLPTHGVSGTLKNPLKTNRDVDDRCSAPVTPDHSDLPDNNSTVLWESSFMEASGLQRQCDGDICSVERLRTP